MSEYVKACDFCKQQIRMSNRLGKWYPSDLDGGIHHCEAKKAAAAKKPEEKPQLKNLLEAQLLLEGIDERVRKLESIVLKSVKTAESNP